MVNETFGPFLTLLKDAAGPVSGEALGRHFGISRVAVAKRIQALRRAGYELEASRRGYHLRPGDKPLPWDFAADAARVVHRETVSSTMDEAWALAWAGSPVAVLAAERQQAGRGRADRRWQSSGGDLLVTLVVRPDLPVTYAGALGLEAAAALAETLRELYALPLHLKWPNDLVSGAGKVGGVLVEAWGPADRPRFYTVGLGLNVHSRPAIDGRPVASLGSLGWDHADRRAILHGWWRRLERWCADPQPSPSRWLAASRPPGLWTVETFDGRVVTGPSLGFDRSGSLLLACGADIHPIRYGEVRRAQGAAS